MPRNYACYVKYSRRGVSGREILALPGSSWELAFDAFRKFFKTKTRKDWNDSLDGKAAQCRNTGSSDGPFIYKPPSGTHESRGLMESKTKTTTEAERTKEDGASGEEEATVTIDSPAIKPGEHEDREARVKDRADTPEGMVW